MIKHSAGGAVMDCNIKILEKSRGHIKQSKLLCLMLSLVFCGISICRCCAASTTEDVVISSSGDKDDVQVQSYKGRSNTQLSLITKGILITKTGDLVIDPNIITKMQSLASSDSDEGEMRVRAECVTYIKGKRVLDTYNIYANMWPPSDDGLHCKKGEGMDRVLPHIRAKLAMRN